MIKAEILNAYCEQFYIGFNSMTEGKWLPHAEETTPRCASLSERLGLIDNHNRESRKDRSMPLFIKLRGVARVTVLILTS